jgi:hypothetical protein
MPGHDEEIVRKEREDRAATSNPAMGDTGVGGTGRTGDIGAGGAVGEGLSAALTGEDPGDLGTSGVRGSGTFDVNDDVGRGPGAVGPQVERSGGGSGTVDPDDDLGGVGTAGDQTDADILERR